MLLVITPSLVVQWRPVSCYTYSRKKARNIAYHIYFGTCARFLAIVLLRMSAHQRFPVKFHCFNVWFRFSDLAMPDFGDCYVHTFGKLLQTTQLLPESRNHTVVNIFLAFCGIRHFSKVTTAIPYADPHEFGSTLSHCYH